MLKPNKIPGLIILAGASYIFGLSLRGQVVIGKSHGVVGGLLAAGILLFVFIAGYLWRNL